jgi:mRNA interferase RelE/StbE
MAWTIEIDDKARRELAKLGRPEAQRILRFLNDRLATLEDPRLIGEALHGDKLGDFWKYRVGDYRIIASIEDRILRILIVRIGHRRQVYR